MNQVSVIMPDDSVRTFNAITTDLDNALRLGGLPVKTDSAGNIIHQYTTRQFGGGWLLDNCPLNVIMGQGWTGAQIEAAKAEGIEPYCPECADDPACMEAFYPEGSTSKPTERKINVNAMALLPDGTRKLVADLTDEELLYWGDSANKMRQRRNAIRRAIGWEESPTVIVSDQPSDPIPSTPFTPGPEPVPDSPYIPAGGSGGGGGGGGPAWTPTASPTPTSAPTDGPGQGLVLLAVVVGLAIMARRR